MTRADLKHCGKIPEAREDLNRSVREWRIESRQSIKSLEGMGSSSHRIMASSFNLLTFQCVSSLNINNLLPLFIYNSHRATLYQKAMSEFLSAFHEVSVV